MKDHYETLGVEPDATDDEIKAAYRRRASQLHSDRGGDDDVMAELNVARDTLLDPEQRAKYDELGADHAYVEKKARDTLSSLFERVISELPNGDGVALLTRVNWHLTALRQSIELAHLDAQRQLAQAEKKAMRFRIRPRAAAVPNLFDTVVKKLLDEHRNRVDTVSNDLKACDHALKLLNGYEAMVDVTMLSAARQGMLGVAP